MADRRGTERAPLASDATVPAAFDTLPAQVAVVDADGVILETNRAWREFGAENGLRGSVDSVGENYLTLCEGADDETAGAAAAGIRTVLAGEREEFSLEYPCRQRSGAGSCCASDPCPATSHGLWSCTSTSPSAGRLNCASRPETRRSRRWRTSSATTCATR